MLDRHSLLVCLALATLAACGSSKGPSFDTGSHDGGPGSGGDGSALRDGSMRLSSGDSQASMGPLAISPLNPTVTVNTGQPLPTVAFKATVGGQPANVVWSIDRGELGAINAAGRFTPTGNIGGKGTISASDGSLTVKTGITVNIQTSQMGDPAWMAIQPDAGAGGYGGVGGAGPGAVATGAQVSTLNGSPTADATVSILYPYDGTVWPQGLLAPLLQWNPGAHTVDSVYVHLHENNYDYKGYLAANATPFINVPIPQEAWTTLALSNGGEPVSVTVTFAQGATAYGPYTETWTIAQANLQGTIYYNSYGTALVKNSDTVDSYGNQYGAGTLAIKPGATAPTLVAGINSPGASGNGTGCRVCHTVAANGQSLLTQVSNANASDYSPTVRIDLASDPTAGAGTPLATPGLDFPALYKDGSLLLSNGGGMAFGGITSAPSQLYSLPAGTPVAGTTGLPSGFYAALPTFSPDGAHLSYDFWAGSFMVGSTMLTGDQRSLGILDFDGTSAFSNPRVLYTPPGSLPAVFSSFFPDSSGVAFEVELSGPGGWGFTWQNNTGELWWVDVASGTAHRLDALNGYDSGGSVYLPNNTGGMATHTSAQDATLNYEPTVNPIASGGYAWVVFTSRRMYGNVAQEAPWVSDPRDYPWLEQITDKKLWVAAIDLNAKAGTDPSHPAFYLPAQELHAGNARGYWTVEPCRANGQSCQAGDQCCGGFCEPAGDGGALVCTTVVPTCSAEYDKCTSSSDCCGAAQGVTCINSVCTAQGPK
jgi:hypothetical protein